MESIFELNRLYNLKIELINKIEKLKEDKFQNLLDDLQNYFVKTLSTECKFINQDDIIEHTFSNFKIQIIKGTTEFNICVNLIMPTCFGDGTIIELQAVFSEPPVKFCNNFNEEIIRLNNELSYLQKNKNTNVKIMIAKIDCPSRRFPGDFEWDKNKTFNNFQEALQYSVDDVMTKG